MTTLFGVQQFGLPQKGDKGDPGQTLTRLKSEVLYTGQSLVIGSTATNLVTILKALTAASGTLAPFFDTTANKLVVQPQNMTVNFKLNLVGTWSLGVNRSMSLSFVGTSGNNLIALRNDSVGVADTVSFSTFLSVDATGNLATNGAVVNVACNAGTFTASQILLIAEQLVPS